MHDRSFRDHRDEKGKAQVMMISAIDEETIPQPEVNSDLDQRAQRFKVYSNKSSYGQMDFNLEQRLAITKAIIELADSTEVSNLV